ncbi:hypothetical protein COCVIDRAFT_97102 [Bipolaris victoriae FI3]|uniref:Uncharacterized protein n=1 Tax=Bipolaris victoriae (strain FI3) TaxID=930091 RepID=W7EP53_BIPV3|nr:hypothetical protein COCVIDRAFT_97102 [Bipolaris victoriae FI3]
MALCVYPFTKNTAVHLSHFDLALHPLLPSTCLKRRFCPTNHLFNRTRARALYLIRHNENHA